MAYISNAMAMFLLQEFQKDEENFLTDPPSCLMIFRLLPEISKNLLLRGLISTEDGTLYNSDLKNHDFFINTSKDYDITVYIAGLQQLRILTRIKDDVYKINNNFFETMKKVLDEGLINEKEKFHRKSKGYEKFLEKGINKFYKFINEKIFNLLDKDFQDNEINNFLVEAEFLKKDEIKRKYQLGPSLKMLLDKTEELIRSFFYEYISKNKDFKNLKEKKYKFFRLLFYLTTLEPGTYFTEFPQKYYEQSFDIILDFMNQTGFLLIKEEKKDNSNTIKKYFCTPLIQSLFDNNNISEDYAIIKYGDENAERFLYVETNMRFYAFMPQVKSKKKGQLSQTSFNLNLNENSSSFFTENDSSNFNKENNKDTKDEKINFYINILKSLFKIEMKFPENGLIGYITRDNLRKILKNADSVSIMQFLSDHMSLNYDDVTTIDGKKYLINESVVNQILVLENEQKSVETVEDVVCYCDFYDSQQYNNILKIMQKKRIPVISKGKIKDNKMTSNSKEKEKNDKYYIVINHSDEKRIEKEFK